MGRLFPKWLRERGGIVVYQNHVLDSPSLGDQSFMPARFLDQNDEWHQAPARIGDLPSVMQERVDHIRLDEFGGDVDAALGACFREA